MSIIIGFFIGFDCSGGPFWSLAVFLVVFSTVLYKGQFSNS